MAGLKRGILAGAAAEHELHQFASQGTFTIDLGQLVDRTIKAKRIGGFAPEQLEAMRSAVIGWVRQFQANDGLTSASTECSSWQAMFVMFSLGGRSSLVHF